MSSGGGLVKVVGIDKDRIRDFYDLAVSDEAWAEFLTRRNGALLGIDLAGDRELHQRYIWKEGSEFAMADFGGLTLYMAGTFIPRDPTLRSVILVGDKFLMEVDGRLGVANQVITKVRHKDDADAVMAAIDGLDFPIDLETGTQSEALEAAVSDLDDMLRYVAHVIVAVAIVILLGLANATSMAVRERVREVGMLRSLGFSRRRVVGLVAGESLLLAVLGGLVGCGGAFAAVRWGGMTIHAGSYSFPVQLSALVVFAAGFGAMLVGLFGGLPAGIRASRRPIVEAIRSVD